MTPTRRVTVTAGLFVLALACLAGAAATHTVWPLFVAWIPLIGVPWLLTRSEAPDGAPGSGVSGQDGAEPRLDDPRALEAEPAPADLDRPVPDDPEA